ncbi:FUSC family protein [Lichenicola sp.]|uniref:FUSC family protein n=1 Tax=Lichenicola sp. TaxID=2804529 RepID=UPI003AFF6CD4
MSDGTVLGTPGRIIRRHPRLAVDRGDPPLGAAQLLRLLAPTPGRLGNTLRLTILVLVTITLSEIFRIPEAALSAYVVLFVSRGEAASTVMTAVIVCIAVVLALLLTIALFGLSLAEPALRIPLVALATFVAMFLSRTSSLGAAFFGAGFIIAYALTLGDQVVQLSLMPGETTNAAQFALPELAFMPPEEALVHFLLWIGLVVSMPIALVIGLNLLTGRDPGLLLRTQLGERLAMAARLCRGESGAEAGMGALAAQGIDGLLGLDHLSGLLHRHRRPEADMHALIREIDRLGLVLLAWARLAGASPPRAPLSEAAAFCDAAGQAVRTGTTPGTLAQGEVAVPDPHDVPGARPLARELARTLAALRTALTTTRAATRAPGAAASPRRLLAPDAFSNPAYPRFAFKVTLAVMACYAIETLTDWPAIHTCMITCFFVSLDTVGETVHKAALRITGCLIGGALGIGTILLLMPLMTDLGSLLLVLAVVTFIAGWVATGSDRISYAGWQIALAFYLTVLQGFGPTLDMQTARDRIIGILLGNVVVFVVFTTIWPVRVAGVVRANLAKAVGQFAGLMQPVSSVGHATPAGSEAWHGISQAIGKANGLLVNDAYETRRPPAPHPIDAATLARVHALVVPSAVILALASDPAWPSVPEAMQAVILAHHRNMASWFAECAAWIRGDAADCAPLPDPPRLEVPGATPSIDPAAPDVAVHLQARSVWYALMQRDIRTILDQFQPQRTADHEAERDATLALA